MLGEGGWWWLQPPVKQKNRHGNQAPSPSAEGTRSKGGGWRPGLAGVPAGLILNFKEVPAGGKDTCSRGGGLSRKKVSIGISLRFSEFYFLIHLASSGYLLMRILLLPFDRYSIAMCKEIFFLSSTMTFSSSSFLFFFFLLSS